VQAVAGIRVSSDTEEQGLDLRLHGERGYNM
jgi:ammonia channel protein AmtB